MYVGEVPLPASIVLNPLTHSPHIGSFISNSPAERERKRKRERSLISVLA